MNAKPRIVVLGGGFGGLESLFYLKHKLGSRAELTLVTDQPKFLFKPTTIYIPFDFIELSVRRGRSLLDAILESRVVRLRPILLTAGAAMLSSLPITLDPIFCGLGWSLIFGLLASTLFTLFVIPVTYWLLKAKKST